MPERRFRSTSVRKVHRRVPGSRTVLRYERRKPSRAKCGKCSQPLPGIPRERPYRVHGLAHTQKRPSRPFGGTLCSECMRQEMRRRARSA
ncbi:50S ribosomal protein L34e [Candidatus Woesearchaeota archaeon]|nr:50S ribosomal protein L34e [Candidatus Woesearchaeota archaeon]